MNNRNSAVLCFILLVYFVKQDAFADGEDKSDELEDQEFKLQVEGNFSAETSGPPDSHEAMNNREISSKLSKSNREKRSYEFLMGLVNNNSKFEVTNVDLPPPEIRKEKGQIAANEALLELMVKIAADPEQWEKVHKLLQKIDNDLTTSKKILNRIHNSIEDNNLSITDVQTPMNIKEIFFEKKQETLQQQTPSSLAEQTIELPASQDESTKKPSVPMQNSISLHEQDTLNTNQVQKMVVILNGKNKQKSSKNHTETALKTNKWPQFEPEGRILYKPETELERHNTDIPKYPWQSESKSGSKTYPRNFAYHRVTGHPLYHTNFDKNPKAYIAVSVIAPKPLHSRPQDEDLILENELRQLKPWTHKQNLKNMAAIRSRWVIQSENNNKENTAP